MSKWDFNLYGPIKKDDLRTATLSFAQWQAAGMDTHSVVADPQFTDPANGDFRFKSDEASKKIGFVPFDLTDVGPRAAASDIRE